MEYFKVFQILALILVHQSVVAQRSSFGERCNKLLRCDSKASLACEDSICQCIIPDKMVFDVNKGKCVTMAGEKCVYTAVEMSQGNDTSESETKRWREELDCVSRASCSSNGYCSCDNGYFENYNGTCEEKHFYGESCDLDSHCKENSHLVCNTKIGTCNCDASTSYDLTKKRCVGRVGSLCKHNSECVANAQCPVIFTPTPVPTTTSTTTRHPGFYYHDPYEPSYHDFYNPTTFSTTARPRPSSSTPKRLEYTSEMCSCKSGFTHAGDGTCSVSYGEKCDYHVASKRCLPGMICREGSCSCKYQYMQVYNYTTLKCNSLVGGPCSEFEECISHAECVSKINQTADITASSLPKYCQCKKGFIEVNRRCEIEYGQECGSSKSGDTKCDSIAPLQCIEGSCQCNLLEYYDEKMKLCRGLEGAMCSTKNGKEHFCTSGARCKSFRNKADGIGQCVCKETYMSTMTRKCNPVTTEKGSSKMITTSFPQPSSTRSTIIGDVNTGSTEKALDLESGLNVY